MFGEPAEQDRELVRQWVATWRRAGAELDQIRRREIEQPEIMDALARLRRPR